ncbi:MAG: hypothetical protein PVJ39_21040, partial [Gammaproteobacteria bacterium]
MASKARTIDLESFNELVNGIYDAAMDSTHWPRVLKSFALALNSHSGLLRIQDLQAKDLVANIAYGLDPWFQQQYADYFIHLDHPTKVLSDLETGAVVQTATLLPEDHRKTEYYNDYVKPQGSEQIIGSMLAKDDPGIALLCLHRTDRIGYYEPHEIEVFKLLVPHLQRAINISRHLLELNSQCRAAGNILDRLHTAVILVD